MAGRTGIEWTDATWNPVTGCDEVSAGCDNCYARKLAERLQRMGNKRYANGFKVTLHPDLVAAPRSWKQSRRIFVNSMSDLYHRDVPDHYIAALFDTMNKTPQHQYQILTKRPQRMLRIAPSLRWTPNIWQGVSIEDQNVAWRADLLRLHPAKVRFVSAEPLIGPLELDLTGIHWLIAGGESGAQRRPMDPTWVRSLRDQCASAGTAFFFKQWGGHRPGGPAILDGFEHREYPVTRGGVVA